VIGLYWEPFDMVANVTELLKVHTLSYVWFFQEFPGHLFIEISTLPGYNQYFPGVFLHLINGTDTRCHFYM